MDEQRKSLGETLEELVRNANSNINAAIQIEKANLEKACLQIKNQFLQKEIKEIRANNSALKSQNLSLETESAILKGTLKYLLRPKTSQHPSNHVSGLAEIMEEAIREVHTAQNAYIEEKENELRLHIESQTISKDDQDPQAQNQSLREEVKRLRKEKISLKSKNISLETENIAFRGNLKYLLRVESPRFPTSEISELACIEQFVLGKKQNRDSLLGH